MNQKLLCYCMFGLLLMGSAYAQTKVISGKVTSADGGTPVAGVSVIVVGTRIGSSTDNSGNYSINVPADAKQLSFTFIGFQTQVQSLRASGSTVLNISLQPLTNTLEEVVVTGAYGIKSNSREVSYNAQVVSQQQLNTVRQPDINNALAGKVTGIQVRSQSPAALGRETDIRLRGVNGLSGGSGTIYVVDGTILPNINDLNLDDIDNVSVLQGPAAAALFGSQGANGAIVITLKRGASNGGVGITVNLGAQFDNAYILPNYQNLYAGGSTYDPDGTGYAQLLTYHWEEGQPEEWKVLDGKQYHDYQDDASWGPKMEGQEYIPWYAWYGGHSRSFQTASLTPQPDNAKDFFETGVTLNNGITFSQSTDKIDFKATYNNQNVNGLLPTTSMSKNNLNLMTTYRLSGKLELSADVNYITRKLNGQIDDNYGSASTGSFNQWFHRDLDMGVLKELQDLNHNDIYATWNKRNPNAFNSDPEGWYKANYWYNPYTALNFNPIINQNDRLYGSIAFTYKIIEGLQVKGTYRKQQNTTFAEDKTYSELENSAYQTGVFAGYSTSTSYSNRENLEFLASYDKKVDDFSINANLGTDFFTYTSKSNGANTNQGLVVPNGFFISNSVQTPSISNGRTDEKYRALFGMATVGYKNFLFVNGTLRNDWYSTLPPQDNDVLSKSFGGSFVFSDLLPENFSWLNYGKLRYSWGETPEALGTTSTTFGAYRYPGMAYSIGSFQWNGNILMPTPDQLVDANIKGAVSTQQEYGIDLRFLKDRVGASFTYWDGTSKGFPYALTINGASGYTSLLTNTGEITKKGIEVQLTGQPVVLPKFSWNVNFTFSNLIENDVKEISKEFGVTRTGSVANVAFANLPQLYHEEGMRWGQLYGTGILRNDQGVPILNDDGSYQVDPDVFYGSVVPDYTGGIQNNFTFLNAFSLAFNIDYSFGGKFASLSNAFGSYSGLTARTAAINDKGFNVRDPVETGGGVKVTGVNEAGEPVTYYVNAQDYYHSIFDNGTVDEFIYDLDFIKLREVSIGYELPVNKWNLRKIGVQNANISIVGRNLWLIHSKTNGDFDPSEVDSILGETAQLPGTRGWGFNLRIGF